MFLEFFQNSQESTCAGVAKKEFLVNLAKVFRALILYNSYIFRYGAIFKKNLWHIIGGNWLYYLVAYERKRNRAVCFKRLFMTCFMHWNNASFLPSMTKSTFPGTEFENHFKKFTDWLPIQLWPGNVDYAVYFIDD